jgi:F0F1-type ATP synthase assembly protein I
MSEESKIDEDLKEVISDAKEIAGEFKEKSSETAGEIATDLKEKINAMSVEQKVYSFYLILVIVCSILGMLLTKYEILSTSSAKGMILGMMFGIVLSVYLWFMVGQKLVEEEKLMMNYKDLKLI